MTDDCLKLCENFLRDFRGNEADPKVRRISWDRRNENGNVLDTTKYFRNDPKATLDLRDNSDVSRLDSSGKTFLHKIHIPCVYVLHDNRLNVFDSKHVNYLSP